MSSRKIAVIDSETDPFKKGRIPAPFLWGFYDGETYLEWETADEMVRYLQDKRYIVYAHNGGKFDYHFMLDYIDLYEKVMIINSRLAKFKIGDCEFRDSYNILPTALSAFQKTEIDYGLFEPGIRDQPEVRREISNYLKDDCIFLYNYVAEFIDRFGMHLTQASCAMKTWQKISGRDAPHDSGGVIYQKFAPYYYGGRCQSFEFGEINEPLEMADINSAYPYAMLSQHPISLSYSELTAEEWESLDDEMMGPGFVKLRARSNGNFPYRGSDGSLYFPDDGEWRDFCITGWEFLASRRTGHLEYTNIEQAYLFDETIDFSDYILKFYEERKIAKETGDKAGNIFCKLLMNSLYGKFGSNPENYRDYIIVPSEIIDENGMAPEGFEFNGEFGSRVLASRAQDEEEQHFYNVATSASITGYVRAFMWESLCQCDGVVYCDTDSICARSCGGLEYGPELGQWELEGHFSGGGVAGKKLYAFKYADSNDWKIASKGVRLNAAELMEIARGKEITFEPENPTFSIHKSPHFVNRTIRMQKKTLPADKNN